MKNKLKVVILPTAYPNIYRDHSSIFVQDQAEALAKYEDLHVNVIGALPVSLKQVWSKKLFKFGIFKHNKNNVNVKILLFPAIPKLRRFNNFLRCYLNKKLIKKHLDYNKIDLIHVHNSVAGEAAVWVKKAYNIPFIVTEHSSAFARKTVKKKEIKLFEKIYKESCYNIAVSEKFCKLLHETFNIKFEYVPNVVDTDFFIPAKKNNDKQRFRFINIANLNENKNQKALINAFIKAFKGNKNVLLSIFGNGPEYFNLQNEISNNGTQSQIILHGYADRGTVKRELQQSDAFVLSSKYETFGVVLIESMSCGLPVIATKCGGPESIITDEKLGILVENGNIGELSKAMQKVFNSNYDSTYLRKYAVENFSEKAVSDKLINIYREICNAN
ncbi:glycosyltransferase [Flexistipes sp.]|uniref:glycosyltransferase n=1 Tax=Flexistipes sp. TaxID=3088135 RepID=UPI002E1D8B26|nr:glycosyltransferase [Flexistipes sp.]